MAGIYDPLAKSSAEFFLPPLTGGTLVPTDMAVTNNGDLWLAKYEDGRVFIPDPINASEDSVREYSTEIGLPGGGVTSIFLEEDDVMWVGTYEGLARCQIETGY